MPARMSTYRGAWARVTIDKFKLLGAYGPYDYPTDLLRLLLRVHRHFRPLHRHLRRAGGENRSHLSLPLHPSETPGHTDTETQETHRHTDTAGCSQRQREAVGDEGRCRTCRRASLPCWIACTFSAAAAAAAWARESEKGPEHTATHAAPHTALRLKKGTGRSSGRESYKEERALFTQPRIQLLILQTLCVQTGARRGRPDTESWRRREEEREIVEIQVSAMRCPIQPSVQTRAERDPHDRDREREERTLLHANKEHREGSQDRERGRHLRLRQPHVRQHVRHPLLAGEEFLGLRVRLPYRGGTLPQPRRFAARSMSRRCRSSSRRKSSRSRRGRSRSNRSRSRCKGRQRLAEGLPARRAQKHSTYSASAPRHCSFENEEACRGVAPARRARTRTLRACPDPP